MKALGILRSNVADGCKGFGILIDKNPMFKNIAFDEKIKRAVEVDQDAVIKYNLQPRANYLFLIARLNTDMKGTIIGDDVTVEYLSLSQTLYNEYTDGVLAVGKCNAVMLTKVKKSADGRDFSYIKVQGANIKVTPELQAKIKEMRHNANLVSTLWQMVDSSTSMSITDYVAKLIEAKDPRVAVDPTHVAITASAITSQAALNTSSEAAPGFGISAPEFPATDKDEFDGDDDFATDATVANEDEEF